MISTKTLLCSVSKFALFLCRAFILYESFKLLIMNLFKLWFITTQREWVGLIYFQFYGHKFEQTLEFDGQEAWVQSTLSQALISEKLAGISGVHSDRINNIDIQMIYGESKN